MRRVLIFGVFILRNVFSVLLLRNFSAKLVDANAAPVLAPNLVITVPTIFLEDVAFIVTVIIRVAYWMT